jgi:hypothetical protein
MKIRYITSWITVRPRRWFFKNCLSKGSFGVRWLPERREEYDNYCYVTEKKRSVIGMIRWPNVHWVLAYYTAFKFCSWLYRDGWRPFCKWNPYRATFPWYARLIQRIGQTTAGVHISGNECYHCASPAGDPSDLADDETGTTFILKDHGSSSTMDGIDHWFNGTTICPKCGYRSDYSSSSL